jgi:dUTP pyrophosphatase
MRVYKNEKLQALGIDFVAPRLGDAGYDVYAVETCVLMPMERALIETGLHLEIPMGYVGLVKDRSSIASAGLHTMAGVIDASYRGEVKVLMINLSDAPYTVSTGQKIAQLVVMPIYAQSVDIVETLDDLTETARGDGGFGSTGG